MRYEMQNEISLQELNTQSQTVNNAIITLGDTDDSGKGRHFKSRFIQPGVAGYPGQFGNVLITKQTLDKFIQTMVGVPVIIQHKDITAENADDERVGVVNSVWYDENDGWYWCDGIIWDDTAINLIQDQGWSVSCSYDVKLADNAGGSENNIKYDMEFLDGVFTHLALVNNPRYERATIVFNSKTFNLDNAKEENGRWITVKGTHLFIKDGQSVTEVMKEHGMAVDRKYSKDGAKFDEKEVKKEISKAREEGFETPEDIADYLGLDEDEVREYIRPSDSPNLKELKEKLNHYKSLIQKGDTSIFTKQIVEGLEKQIKESSNDRLNLTIKHIKDLASVAPTKELQPESKSNHSKYLNSIVSKMGYGSQLDFKPFESSKERYKDHYSYRAPASQEFFDEYSNHLRKKLDKAGFKSEWGDNNVEVYIPKKVSNSTDFKEQFIDTFYQALAEVLLEKTEKEL